MRWLTIATLVYSGLLVVALVIVLSTLAAQLLLISRELRDIRTALAGVSTRTAPLGAHLQATASMLHGSVERIEQAAGGIDAALHERVARS